MIYWNTLGEWFVPIGINMNARIQGFPIEQNRLVLMLWSVVLSASALQQLTAEV